MTDLFDVHAIVRLPGDGKATVECVGRHAGWVELTDAERLALEDLLIQIIERRNAARHG